MALTNIKGERRLNGRATIAQNFDFRSKFLPTLHVNSFLSYKHKTIIVSSQLQNLFVCLQNQKFNNMILLKPTRGGFLAYSRGFRAKLSKKSAYKIFCKILTRSTPYNRRLPSRLMRALLVEFPIIYLPFSLGRISFFAPYKKRNFSRKIRKRKSKRRF